MTDGFNILVVDDDREIRASLTRILTSAGYDVRCADGGRRAVASAVAHPPHLILLDVRLDDMDGLEVRQRLKADESTRNIPLMFIIGAREIEECLKGLHVSAVDFIGKPFRPEELLARVKTHLELATLRADLERQVMLRTAELRIANEKLQEELALRRLTEKSLRESEERFRSLTDTAPVGIWVTNPDESAAFYNKQALTFTGRALNQLTGKRWTEILHPEDLEEAYSLYRSAIASRSCFRFECRMRRADGQYRWVLNTGIPRFTDGVYNGHIGTVVDTTEIKKSHEQMIASQKLESLGVLAAGIAHDFNNMLGAIFAESDVALSETTHDSPGRDHIERIKAIAVRASEIVKLLMAYAGGTQQTMEPVDLSLLVTETLDRLRSSLSERAVLHIDFAEGLPTVQANSMQLRQAVVNLITNALEALDGTHGHIAVATEQVRITRPTPMADGTCLSQGEYIRLEVSDTGCGMTSEVRALAFDPFYTTKFLGRGLGLAVIQGIVRGHGGGVNIVSRPGCGSTVEVLLPRTRPVWILPRSDVRSRNREPVSILRALCC